MSQATRRSIRRGFTLAALTSFIILMHAASTQAQWVSDGANIINTNTGNVGIGVKTAGEKLMVNGTISVNRAGSPGNAEVRIYNGGMTAEWAFRQASGTSHNLNISKGVNGIYSDFLTLDTAGNLGVGVTTPGERLMVNGNISINRAGIPGNAELRIYNGGQTAEWAFRQASGTSHNLNISKGVNGIYSDYFTINLNGNVGIGTTTPTAKLDVAGDLNVSGNINAKYQDVAEWVPTRETLSAGTVVVLDTERSNHVLASTTPYDMRVAGVVSAQPGISLGEAGEGKTLVATTGRVKVKVDATAAPIRIGDLLVTSGVAGVAMKSEPIAIGGRQMHAPGTIIGKALESLEKGTGEILVLLSLQ